jgi:cobalt/nickel transport protein
VTRRLGWFIAGGLLVALLLAGVASSFASSSPDGLEATAREGCTFNADDEITGGTCMLQQEREHQLSDSPLADYGFRGIGNEQLSTGLSGIVGVVLTFAIGGSLFWLVRRRPAGTPGDTARGAAGGTASGGAGGSASGGAGGSASGAAGDRGSQDAGRG